MSVSGGRVLRQCLMGGVVRQRSYARLGCRQHAQLDESTYERRIKITNAQLVAVNLTPDAFRGEHEVARRTDVAVELARQLPQGQFEALRARVLDERAYSEIARELRCSEAVVRMRVSRALKTLRTRMESRHD